MDSRIARFGKARSNTAIDLKDENTGEHLIVQALEIYDVT